jgi:histone H3/H4
MAMKRVNRSGFGILMAGVSVLLAVLGVSLSSACLPEGVTARTRDLADGRRALEIGRSCLSEAILALRVSVNTPGNPWYAICRDRKTSAKGMEHWLVGELEPEATRRTVAGEDVSIVPVRVSVWRDFAIDPENGPFDEKYALVTLTADVSVRPAGLNPFRSSVRRQVQRSYHLKQARIASEAPFGTYTLYLHRAPQLVDGRDAYDRTIRAIGSRREALIKHYEREIDEIIKTLNEYLAHMKRRTVSWDGRRKEIAKTEEAYDKLVAVTPFALGLTAPAVVKTKDTLEAMRRELAEDLKKNLERFGLPDEATFRRVAANPYPPENLRADIAFELARGNWPAFRGTTATPDGLVLPGTNLERPVVVERETVNSREIEYQLPEAPEVPRRPVYSLDPKAVQWQDRYANITQEFGRYKREYGEDLENFLTATSCELERHESLFRLLAMDPPEYARQLTNLGLQARRASWFFEDQDSFLKQVVGPDGVARLNGVYAIRGDLTKMPARFAGRARIAVEGNVALCALAKADPRSSLLLYAGGDVAIAGSCEAEVQAPAGRLKSTVIGRTVSHAVVARITHDDEFTVARPAGSSAGGSDGLWVTIAPAPLAETLLRN